MEGAQLTVCTILSMRNVWEARDSDRLRVSSKDGNGSKYLFI